MHIHQCPKYNQGHCCFYILHFSALSPSFSIYFTLKTQYEENVATFSPFKDTTLYAVTDIGDAVLPPPLPRRKLTYDRKKKIVI